MPLVRRIAAEPSSTLFGGAPYQTDAPTQGTITFYTDMSCLTPLTDTPTPLILGECLNVPLPDGGLSVNINSLPTCDNYGTPILVVSDQPDCKNSTLGAEADGGQLDVCKAYSSGTDIGSVQFICFGKGIAPAEPTTTSAAPYTTESPPPLQRLQTIRQAMVVVVTTVVGLTVLAVVVSCSGILTKSPPIVLGFADQGHVCFDLALLSLITREFYV